MSTWTFELLAQADRKTLENVLLAAHAPDTAQLNGYPLWLQSNGHSRWAALQR